MRPKVGRLARPVRIDLFGLQLANGTRGNIDPLVNISWLFQSTYDCVAHVDLV